MPDLFGNHIVGFPTRRLKYILNPTTDKGKEISTICNAMKTAVVETDKSEILH